MTHICVGNLTIIGPDNDLSPGRRQAIIWTNAGILLIGPLGTNFSEIVIEIHTFSFKKTCFKLSSGKWRPFCLGLNVLKLILPSDISTHISQGCYNGTGAMIAPEVKWPWRIWVKSTGTMPQKKSDKQSLVLTTRQQGNFCFVIFWCRSLLL